jgi:hypothetical protein
MSNTLCCLLCRTHASAGVAPGARAARVARVAGGGAQQWGVLDWASEPLQVALVLSAHTTHLLPMAAPAPATRHHRQRQHQAQEQLPQPVAAQAQARLSSCQALPVPMRTMSMRAVPPQPVQCHTMQSVPPQSAAATQQLQQVPPLWVQQETNGEAQPLSTQQQASAPAGKLRLGVPVAPRSRLRLRRPGGMRQQIMYAACTTVSSGRPLCHLELREEISGRQPLLSCPSPRPARQLCPRLCLSPSALCT